MLTNLPPSISIRKLEQWSEYQAAEELQRVVWQMPDWRDAVPANLLVTIQKNNGLVLGAFDGSRLVAFAFSFLGTDPGLGRPVSKQVSHMLAVLPEYQSRKIGVQLKWKQRELSLAQGLSLITWTYDPLLAQNAHLNLVRLGAIARRYIIDAYGEMTDGLNAGLASDRFQVEWWIGSPRVKARFAGAYEPLEWATLLRSGAQPAFEVALDAHNFPYIQRENEWQGEPLFVQIPGDLAALKASSRELAVEWRARTRDLFQRAFALGYAAVDFATSSRGPSRQAAYLLTRDPIETGA